MDDPAQHQPDERDRGEHRHEHADDQHQREAADRRRPEVEQDRRGDDARHVRVEDRVPGAVEAGLDRRQSVLPARSSSLVLSKIRMLASTAMPTESTKAATPASVSVTGIKRKSANDDERVEDQRDAGDHARQSVVDQHEDEHERDADGAGEDALLQEVEAQRRADLAEADLLDRRAAASRTSGR